ncbi:MAG: prepilin-type N-terminal cleavage/methylation domain-containing protein, partial [Firmicutes bacterium]|nr:prepilin-type N-terminal cleavage/methylation domain-containing protein [Bacillota bacterium]
MFTKSKWRRGKSNLFCRQNKGFTLIELLAVIVILAIIAVIATPIITGIIEDSKKESFKRSAEGV